MGKFISLNRIKEQAKLTETLADRVSGDIGTHCEALKDYPYYSLPTGVPRKTQIQADIMRLRRELLALSKMLENAG